MELTNLHNILLDTLSEAKRKNFAGYSKFDALNSPLLNALSLNNKYLRLVYTQAVMRFPFHIRPLLGVRKSRNPKGIALFARAYLFLYELTNQKKFLEEAEDLINWLISNPSPYQSKASWGYNFAWQNTLFLQKKYEPNAVVTTFVCEALVHAYRITKRMNYLNAAREGIDFLINDLPVLYESENERAISYVTQKAKSIVINNQVLTGAVILKIWKHTNEEKLLNIAEKQFNYTINRRTTYNCWYYTHPKENSPILHDNYHTGGILDSLLEYREETGYDKYMNIYWEGLEYYKNNLFEKNGAPRWMNNKKYPFDIHGAAQGIITFSKAGKYKEEYTYMAKQIAQWTIENMYNCKRKEFIYRIGKYMKWNYSLMRWCNAWMAIALGNLKLINTK